jgi:multiple antibiotic resistance protein
VPFLAGPGAITTVIALESQADTIQESASIYVAIVGVLLITWAVLTAAPFVTRKIGQTGMNVFTRIMGLLVMVVGAQLVINGITVVAHGIMKGA